MTNTEINNIEESILKIANEEFLKWKKKFDSLSIYIDPLVIKRYGTDDSYFSEIEFNFWGKRDLLSVFSLIIFMQGKQNLYIDKAKDIISSEIEESYKECIIE